MNQEIGVQEQYVYETASPWRNRGQSQQFGRAVQAANIATRSTARATPSIGERFETHNICGVDGVPLERCSGQRGLNPVYLPSVRAVI